VISRYEGEFGSQSDTVDGQWPTRIVATAALKSFSGQSILLATYQA
jgi:hypothetical protein